MGIGHSQRECSPLYLVEVPTHTGDESTKSEKKLLEAIGLGFSLSVSLRMGP